MYSNNIEKDKFYTVPDIAQYCIKQIEDISSYDMIIEPSAGNGSFSKQLNCIALDIEPENENIKQMNWFDFKKMTNNEKVLVIGNPPFGVRNNLSKKFIQHSIKVGATTIAFILPNVYLKLSNQKMFPKQWHLKKIVSLPKNSFYNKNKSFDIPCSFFIWTIENVKKDLREIKYQLSSDFDFLTRGDTRATICINGNSGKIRKPSEITNSKAEHFIKEKNITYEELLENFNKLNFDFHSSVSGKISWIGQQEILKAYHNIK